MAGNLPTPGSNAASGGGSSGMGWAAASAKRKAIRQVMQKPRLQHGLMHQPTINHSKNGTGTSPPSFGVGGGTKAGGF